MHKGLAPDHFTQVSPIPNKIHQQLLISRTPPLLLPLHILLSLFLFLPLGTCGERPDSTGAPQTIAVNRKSQRYMVRSGCMQACFAVHSSHLSLNVQSTSSMPVYASCFLYQEALCFVFVHLRLIFLPFLFLWVWCEGVHFFSRDAGLSHCGTPLARTTHGRCHWKGPPGVSEPENLIPPPFHAGFRVGATWWVCG
jgi:hypothetical protein